MDASDCRPEGSDEFEPAGVPDTVASYLARLLC